MTLVCPGESTIRFSSDIFVFISSFFGFGCLTSVHFLYFFAGFGVVVSVIWLKVISVASILYLAERPSRILA